MIFLFSIVGLGEMKKEQWLCQCEKKNEDKKETRVLCFSPTSSRERERGVERETKQG